MCIVLWCLMAVLSVFLIGFVVRHPVAIALLVVVVVGSALGAWSSRRHLRGRETWALHPRLAGPLLVLTAAVAQAVNSPNAFLLWMWIVMIPVCVFALLGEYRRLRGRPFHIDRWWEARFTPRRRALIIFGFTGLGLIPLAVWVYVSYHPLMLLVPASALLMLAGGLWFALRQLDDDPPAGEES